MELNLLIRDNSRMELIDNINKTLKGDLTRELHDGSKVAIAASCFSIYAFEELKAQLKDFRHRESQQAKTGVLYSTVEQGGQSLWL